MSEQALFQEIKKHLPLRVYGKGPVLELFREMGFFVDKNTSLQVTDVFKSDESGELVCTLDYGGRSTAEGKGRATAALTNLRLDVTHPLFRKVRDYRNRVADEVVRQSSRDVNSSAFRVGDLYRKK